MKIRLIVVGKLKETYFSDAVAEYRKRLSKYAETEIVEVEDEKTKENASEAENELVLKKEGERILSKLKDKDHAILLDIRGETFDSETLSVKLQKLMNEGNSALSFVIGGSLGVSEEVRKRADERWSFSKLTFPHQLMRVILLEQIYRAFRILRNEPYHK